jgi:hypothetical protein
MMLGTRKSFLCDEPVSASHRHPDLSFRVPDATSGLHPLDTAGGQQAGRSIRVFVTHASVRNGSAVLDDPEEALEAHLHMHLLMAMEERQPRFPWNDVYLRRLIRLQGDDILLHS